ncbi:MAG: hypothetical protein ACPH5V_12720, partial [Alcanivorax sp.]
KTFVADSPDLAIGQGNNKGVLVQMRGDAVSGTPHQKPGTALPGSGQEYQTDAIGEDAIDQVQFLPGHKPGKMAQRLLGRNFSKQELPDGGLLYTRDGVTPSPIERVVDQQPDTEPLPQAETLQAAPEAPAQAGVSRSGGQGKRQWKKDGRKVWRSDDGMIITNESMTVGGNRIKNFFVYENAQERGRGNNFASAETYAEAKRKAESGENLQLEQQTEEQQTEEQLAEQDRAKKDAAAKADKEEREVEQRRKADSEAKDFRLSGSDRPADVAAAGGQTDIFGAQPEAKRTQAKPDSEGYERRLAKRKADIEAANSKADVDAILAEHSDDPDGHLEGYGRLES